MCRFDAGSWSVQITTVAGQRPLGPVLGDAVRLTCLCGELSMMGDLAIAVKT